MRKIITLFDFDGHNYVIMAIIFLLFINIRVRVAFFVSLRICFMTRFSSFSPFPKFEANMLLGKSLNNILYEVQSIYGTFSLRLDYLGTGER